MAKELHDLALEDLDRLEPATWTDVYGRRLCEELATATKRRAEAGRWLGRAAELTTAGNELSGAVYEALIGFCRASGWRFQGKGVLAGQKPRWKATVAFAKAINTAAGAYLAAVKEFSGQAGATKRGRSVGGQKPRASDVQAAARAALKGLVGQAPDDVQGPRRVAFEKAVESLLANPCLGGKGKSDDDPGVN